MSVETLSNDHKADGRRQRWRAYVRPSPDQPQPWSDRPVWLLAFWALVAAVVLTVIWGSARIETRLADQSLARLTDSDIDFTALDLRWSYRDLEVHGELPADISEDRLIEILRQHDGAGRSFLARGIRNIAVLAEPAAEIEPVFVLPEEIPSLSVAMVMQRDMATLDGIVESAEQRRVLVDALLATGVESIHDNLDIAQSDENAAIVDTKVDVLANMVKATRVEDVTRFSANLNRLRLEYQVSALSAETAAAVENAASVAIVNFDISGDTTVKNNAIVSVDVTSDAETLKLEGSVQSEEQHRRLTFAAKEASGADRRVIDSITIESSEVVSSTSDARIGQLAAMVARFTQGVNGQIQMRGGKLSVDASVDKEEVRASLLESVDSARAGSMAVIERIILAEDAQAEDPVTALQSKLDRLAVLVAENVTFPSGTSTLTNDARTTLDLVVEVLTETPDLKVEIEGHTDNVGRATVNEELSRLRAAAVRQYLIDRSIDAERLVAVGYGARNPLAPNDTSEGRKRNRRVHFHVPNPQKTEQ